MIIRWLILPVLFQLTSSEFCGNNKIPYGLEVHKNGALLLLCSRPNCHEKKYAECPERAEATSCPENTTWVGGLERRVDGSVKLMCCDYELLGKYGETVYRNVVLRRGEYFEAEEKLDPNGEDVISFDLIADIKRKNDTKGEFFSLIVARYYCGKLPEQKPAWALKKHWPYWRT